MPLSLRKSTARIKLSFIVFRHQTQRPRAELLTARQLLQTPDADNEPTRDKTEQSQTDPETVRPVVQDPEQQGTQHAAEFRCCKKQPSCCPGVTFADPGQFNQREDQHCHQGRTRNALQDQPQGQHNRLLELQQDRG